MFLTEFQKEICLKIDKEIYYDINDFIDSQKEYLVRIDASKIVQHSYYPPNSASSFEMDVNDAWETNNFQQLTENILQFLSLIESLYANKIIMKVPRYTGGQIYPLFFDRSKDGRYFPEQTLLTLIESANNYGILRLPNFNIFISNNFKTESELQIEHEAQNNTQQIEILKQQSADEKNARTKAEERDQNTFAFTKRIAWASLAVSGISIIVSIVNIVTYTTNRDIKITKDSAFPDTTKVIILNQEPAQKIVTMPSQQTNPKTSPNHTRPDSVMH